MLKLNASEKSIIKVYTTMMKIRALFLKSPRYKDSLYVRFGEKIFLYDDTTTTSNHSAYFVASYQGVIVRIYKNMIQELEFSYGIAALDFVKWSRDFLISAKLYVK